MENNSGLRPLGVAVLIQPYEPERKGALIEVPDFVQSKAAMVDNRATVVEVGPTAWHDEGVWEKFLWFFRRWVYQPRAKAGDKVLVTKFAGYMARGPKDGQLYRFVNDRDIFAGIDDEVAYQIGTLDTTAFREPTNAEPAATYPREVANG